jgi:tetratricopeptide (TPR) repeat protein
MAETIAPANARDHYLLATAFARTGDTARLHPGRRGAGPRPPLSPRHYWSLVQRGICYHELGQYTLTTADFSTCIGLWSGFAWGYFNRGCALDQAGNKAGAIRDYTDALQRDPQFLLAYLNRGLARLELK